MMIHVTFTKTYVQTTVSKRCMAWNWWKLQRSPCCGAVLPVKFDKDGNRQSFNELLPFVHRREIFCRFCCMFDVTVKIYAAIPKDKVTGRMKDWLYQLLSFIFDRKVQTDNSYILVDGLSCNLSLAWKKAKLCEDTCDINQNRLQEESPLNK